MVYNSSCIIEPLAASYFIKIAKRKKTRMMEDRLGDLKKARKEDDDAHQQQGGKKTVGGSEIVDGGGNGNGSDGLEELTQVFRKIESDLGKIKLATVNLKKITQYNRGKLKEEGREGGGGGGNDLEDGDKLINATNELVNEARTNVQRLFKWSELSKSEDKIRRQQSERLRKEFLSVAREYQAAQEERKQNFVESFKQQAKIISPGITEKEISSLLETSTGENGEIENLFQQRLMMLEGVRHAEAKKEYHLITKQHEDLMILEKSICMLLQLFQEVDLLVQQQQDNLDLASDATEAAVVDAEKAVEELEVAREYQKKATKRRLCCCCVTGAVVATAAGGAAAVAGSDAAKVGMLAACTVM